jgi:hypothetical protein
MMAARDWMMAASKLARRAAAGSQQGSALVQHAQKMSIHRQTRAGSNLCSAICSSIASTSLKKQHDCACDTNCAHARCGRARRSRRAARKRPRASVGGLRAQTLLYARFVPAVA